MNRTQERISGSDRPIRRFLVSAFILALIIISGAGPASGASATECLVANTATGASFTSLQPAVDTAQPGVRLTVEGTCHGTTVVDRDVAIKGVRTRDPGMPILDGRGKGQVLRIKPAARVTIRGLVVQGGSKPTRLLNQGGTNTSIPGRGGGILNRGMLRLVGVVVRWNDAGEGGGIYNAGVLRLLGASRITDNASSLSAECPFICRLTPSGAGGLDNHGTATLRDTSRIHGNRPFGVLNNGSLTLHDRSSISHNQGAASQYASGGGVINRGVLILNGSSVISHNTSGRGGGVSNGGTLILNGSSTIRDNRADYYGGGGVFVGTGGSVTLNDASSIRGNWARSGAIGISLGLFWSGGAGVEVMGLGTLTLNDTSSIRGNESGFGGGVYMSAGPGDDAGTLVMTGTSRISGNTARRSGGGLSSDPLRSTLVGVACGPDGNVHRNRPGDCAVIPDKRATDE